MSWSVDKPYVDLGDVGRCKSQYFNSSGKSSVCPDNQPNLTAYTDYRNLEAILDDLRYAVAKKNATGDPFFLSYGIHRPHLPFRFPASFPDATGKVVNHWEKYGPDDEIPLPEHSQAPVGMPGAVSYTHLTLPTKA